MAEFTLPELGENVTAGDVVRVLVKQGDTIDKDQPVLELETDKATIEVPSSVSGRVSAVKVKAGDKVKVGQAILTVDGGEAATDEKKAEPAAQPAEKAKPEPQPAVEQPNRAGSGGAAQANGELRRSRTRRRSHRGPPRPRARNGRQRCWRCVRHASRRHPNRKRRSHRRRRSPPRHRSVVSRASSASISAASRGPGPVGASDRRM